MNDAKRLRRGRPIMLAFMANGERFFKRIAKVLMSDVEFETNIKKNKYVLIAQLGDDQFYKITIKEIDAKKAKKCSTS